MKKTFLALAFAVGLTSFAGSAGAAIINFTSSKSYSQDYPDGQQQLYFDGAAFSIASWATYTDTMHGWNLYNNPPGMGPDGLQLWNLSGTFQFDTSGILTAGTSINSSSPLSGDYYFSPNYTESLENKYWGIAYSLGTGNYDYGWVEMSYDSSTKLATFVAAAMNTTANEAILAGATGTASTAPVPEPSQVAASILLIGGIAGFVIVRRRKALVA